MASEEHGLMVCFVPIYHIYGSNITHERDFGVGEMSVPLHQISERDQNNAKLHIK